MRALALAAFLLLVPACGPEGPEVVTGFHGYPWGTRVADIAELAGSEPVAKKDGLDVFSAEITFQGKQALAGFYVHPETGELLEGASAFALTLEDGETAFHELARALAEAFPTLEREDQLARREGEDLEVYQSDCEYFVYNEHKEVWRVEFTNPGGPGDHAGLWLRVSGRSPRLTVYYRGARGDAWAEAWRKEHEGEEPPSEMPTEPPQEPERVRKSA